MTEIERIEGRCYCGASRYRAWGPWFRLVECYCQRCRRATGTGEPASLFAARENLEWLSGEENVARRDFSISERFPASYCQFCRSPLPHLSRGGSAWVIPAGSLDRQPSTLPPSGVIWAERGRWCLSPEEIAPFGVHDAE